MVQYFSALIQGSLANSVEPVQASRQAMLRIALVCHSDLCKHSKNSKMPSMVLNISSANT